MLLVYFIVLGIQLLVVIIFVIFEQIKKNGVLVDIVGFVILFCVIIYLFGSILKIVVCVLVLMMMQGMFFDFFLFVGFIFMFGIMMIVVFGVFGGVIMVFLGIFQFMFGFDELVQVLMIVFYIVMDSFGIVCNVIGDGVIVLIIDKIMGKRKIFESF